MSENKSNYQFYITMNILVLMMLNYVGSNKFNIPNFNAVI